jgi:hypothetical protein
MEIEISKYPWRCLETAEETPIFLGGLLQPPKNIRFLESSVAPPRKIHFPWRFYFGTQGNSQPSRQFQILVVRGRGGLHPVHAGISIC